MVDLVPYCRFHMRPIQLHFLAHFTPSRDPVSKLIPVSTMIQEKLSWWHTRENLVVEVHFPTPQSDCIVTTDASNWAGVDIWERSALLDVDSSSISHKSAGIMGSGMIPASFCQQIEWLQCSGSVRQLDRGSLHVPQQTGWHQIPDTVSAHTFFPEGGARVRQSGPAVGELFGCCFRDYFIQQ